MHGQKRHQIECGVSECDNESSIMRRSCTTGGCCGMVKKKHLVIPRLDAKRDFVRNINGIAIYISYMIFLFSLNMAFKAETCR